MNWRNRAFLVGMTRSRITVRRLSETPTARGTRSVTEADECFLAS